MADFTVGTETQAGANIRPSAPVTTPSVVGPVVDIASKVVGAGINGFFSGQQNQQEVQRQTAINSNIESFTQAQLKLASAVDTGSMSSAEARMRQRANYTAAIANNPGLVNQLADVQKSLTTTVGLAKNVADGTETEQNNLANEKAASAAGWIPPNASPSDRASATQSYLQFQRGQEDIKAQAASIGLQRAKIGLQADGIGLQSASVQLQSAKIGLMQKNREEQSRTALGNIADGYSQKFANDLSSIQQQVANGTMTQQQGIEQANTLHANLLGIVNKVGGDAPSSNLSNTIAPMTERYNNAVKFLSGDIDKQVLENQNTIADAKQKLLIKADPDTSRVIAVSQMFPSAALTLMPAVNNKVLGILGKNMDPTTKPNDPHPDSDSDKADHQTYLNLLKVNMNAVTTGVKTGPKDAAAANTPAEVDTHVSQVLKGINAYQMAVSDPKDYNQVVDWLASPEFGKYASGRGIPSDTATQAKQVLQEQYENTVLPLIKTEYDNAVTVKRTPVQNPKNGQIDAQTTTTEASANIKPVFTGAGITFLPVDGADAATKAKAKDLNAKVAPVVNRLIRMGAHLNGNQNYKQVYESQYSALFGAELPKE
jgi:hypothetical protein